jgi:hypothetical protein
MQFDNFTTKYNIKYISYSILELVYLTYNYSFTTVNIIAKQFHLNETLFSEFSVLLLHYVIMYDFAI